MAPSVVPAYELHNDTPVMTTAAIISNPGKIIVRTENGAGPSENARVTELGDAEATDQELRLSTRRGKGAR